MRPMVPPKARKKGPTPQNHPSIPVCAGRAALFSEIIRFDPSGSASPQPTNHTRTSPPSVGARARAPVAGTISGGSGSTPDPLGTVERKSPSKQPKRQIHKGESAASVRARRVRTRTRTAARPDRNGDGSVRRGPASGGRGARRGRERHTVRTARGESQRATGVRSGDRGGGGGGERHRRSRAARALRQGRDGTARAARGATTAPPLPRRPAG